MDMSLLTSRPGVYIFKDKSGKVIYVGKAVNLKNRVASYFRKNNAFSKQTFLVAQIANINTIEVENELEALILEANLIKKYNPHFNIRLKDDKDYLYIKVTKDPYPMVMTARKKDLRYVKAYFGPYPNSTLVRTTLKSLRRIFKFCSNPPNSSKNLRPKLKACFWYHLGQCSGACTGRVDKRTYQGQIRKLITFLEGRKTSLLKVLENEMARQAKNEKFEEAALVRDQINGINYLTQNTSIKGYLENAEYRQEKRREEVEALQVVLKLSTFPHRIEGYDISHQSGTNTTASMVVLMDGEPANHLYRHFKIKTHGRNDDFASMKEVITRRLKRLINEDGDTSFGERPDLIVIDGGKGQLSAALEAEKEVQTGVPFISLAKKEEIIYTSDNSDGIRLEKSNPASLVVQRIRDEAHRFAVRLHRNLKGKSLIDTLRGKS